MLNAISPVLAVPAAWSAVQVLVLKIFGSTAKVHVMQELIVGIPSMQTANTPARLIKQNG